MHLLKIILSSDKSNVLKTSFIEDRDHLFSETIGISHIFCCLHPLKIDKMIVFDNLFDILIIGHYKVMLCRHWISVNLENRTFPVHYFSHALLPNPHLFGSESACEFCKSLLEEVYMLKQVTTSEEMKAFSCFVWMLRNSKSTLKCFI